MEEPSSSARYFQPEIWPQRELWGQSIPSWPEIPKAEFSERLPKPTTLGIEAPPEGPTHRLHPARTGGFLDCSRTRSPNGRSIQGR
jgi:hypothetical protein